MIRKYLPRIVSIPLFGNRNKYNQEPNSEDNDWIEWQKSAMKFYKDNQKGQIGKVVNHFGFRISSEVDIESKIVLEIGPGIIEHLDYNNGVPANYILADIDTTFLKASESILKEKYGIDEVQFLLVKRDAIEVPDNSIDIVFTFHQLEHVHGLNDYLNEIKRVLKPNGLLVGAVPAEGGLAWGVGRFLTSRRYVKKNMNFDYDKIICWEHPNFVDDIQSALNSSFKIEVQRKRPFRYLPFDFNLSYSFVARNVK